MMIDTQKLREAVKKYEEYSEQGFYSSIAIKEFYNCAKAVLEAGEGLPGKKETKVDGDEFCPECLRSGYNQAIDEILPIVARDYVRKEK